jgi:hypothetical protein
MENQLLPLLFLLIALIAGLWTTNSFQGPRRGRE